MTAAYLDAAKNLAGDLADELKQDVGACEAELHERLGSQVALADEICAHITSSGGKRLRPLLVSLCARATGRDFIPERVAAIGACMEMIHMATLLHDDVIDGAETRRGKATASQVWGGTAAILTGDLMLSKSMDLLAEDGDLRIIRTVSRAVVQTAEGEIAELQARGNFELTREEHYQILKLKTARLLACCCQTGAQIAGTDVATENALSEYGEAIGMGFQIADDILDFRGDFEKTGKPRATDFREGCATLPLILLSEKLTSQERAIAASSFANGVTESDIETMVGWMWERGVFGEAMRIARTYAERAREQLAQLPESPAKELLTALPDLLIIREA